ncbi:MAG: thioesterase family protein [Propionibacteriaceae bacterium]|nr:thioesterase family protein [Propionibacteriaceae bacterium]
MFRVAVPLRWSDLDAQGHVGNPLVADYMQEARAEFFRAGPCSKLLDDGVVVVGHQVRYDAPIGYDEAGVEVALGIARLGGARFEVAYELHQGGTRVAVARTVLCPFDFQAQRPTRLSSVDRAWLAEHEVTVEPLRELTAPALGEAGTITPCSVRWSDLDSYGHVNNVKVFDLLMQARITATTSWDQAMTRAGAGQSSLTWLIARQDVDYVNQIGYRVAPYRVRTAPVSVGTSSITLAAEISDPDQGTLFARGRTVLVAADQQLRKTALPEPLCQQLQARLVSPR